VNTGVTHLHRTAVAVVIGIFTIIATAVFVPTGSSTAAVVRASVVGSASSGSHHEPRVDSLVREHFRLTTSPSDRIAPNAANYAARTTVESPLLLFLAATGHHPSQYKDFLTVARQHGYHVLALDYWNNGMPVERICGTNATCYTDVQRNRLDGSHPSAFSSVNQANSILNRLQDSLAHLRTVDPAGHWQQYLTGHSINWSDVVVAGHSQGGGEAAYISHIHSLRGVLMFSSPVDSDAGINASWMSRPGATPSSRMYGFDDSGDMFSARIIASWNALGMGKFAHTANDVSALPTGSHELVSTRALGDPRQSHLRDITDAVPMVGRAPVFGPVWNWMLSQPYSAGSDLQRVS
jgi:hypothetical protein